MKLKTLLIVVAILAVVSLVVYWTGRPAVNIVADSRVGQPLLNASAVESAAKIKISDQGKTVLLAKQNDGSWRVTSYYDLPADFQKLSTFVSDLSSAKVEQFVTGNPTKMSRLEFKDTQIQLLDSADKSLETITLGKNAEAGGRFLRYGDEPKAYRTNLSAWIESDSKAWADSMLPTFKPDDVAKVEIDFDGTTPVEANRVKKGEDFTAANAPAGEKLKSSAINSLLASLGTLRFANTADLTDANVTSAKQNQRSVKITTFDGTVISVAMGRKPSEKIVKKLDSAKDAKAGLDALQGMAEVAKAHGASGAPVDLASTKINPPEIETTPAGPVFAFIQSSDTKSEINNLSARRAFEIADYTFTSLPQKPGDLFEPAPVTKIEPKKADPKP